MKTLSQIANDIGLTQRPLAVRTVFQKLGVNSLREAVAADDAAHAIASFHAQNLGFFSVGSPKGPLTKMGNGSFVQSYNFGQIVKPLDATPFIAQRFEVDLRIAGVRCFGTNDPGLGGGGEDEPYILSTVYAIDPEVPDKAVQNTKKFGPDEIGEISSPQVFAKEVALVDGPFKVPGQGSIKMHIVLMDQEHGNPDDIKSSVSDMAQKAMVAGLAAVPVAGAGVAALGDTGAKLMKVIGDEFGSLIGDLFGDDLIAQLDFVIDNAFLQKVVDDRDHQTQNRKSDSIPGVVYNFPQLKEDETPEGRSWLFDRGSGNGTYRMFFIVKVAATTPFQGG